MQLTKPTLRLTADSKLLKAVQRANSARSKSATPTGARRVASATCRLVRTPCSPTPSVRISSASATISEGRGAPQRQTSAISSAKRQVSPILTRRERHDEEAIKTRIFWEEWAEHVYKDWTAVPQGESQVKKQLVFSGQCGTEPTLQRSSSIDSLETNLSLLSMSTYQRERPAKRRRRKRVVKKEEKTDWSKLSRLVQTKGMLERWIRQDQGRLQTTGQTPPIESLLERPKATDAMTPEERSLLYHCALRSGLMGTRKSLSVENIMTIHQQRTDTGLSIGSSRASTATGPSSGKPTSSSQSRSKRAARVPSPRTIGEAERRRPRPGTSHGCPSQHGRRPQRRQSSVVMSEATYRQLRVSMSEDESRAPPSPTRSHMVIPDLESKLSLKVQRTVAATLEALHKSTGVGSNTTEVVRVPGEYGRYTADDYARYPRYPQHVRIAPQLSRLIRDDIQDRMGRPRKHALRVRDIVQFDQEMSQLGRAQRNLMIFNWLNSVTEEEWEKGSAPSIYDVEGMVEETRYPDLLPGAITGQSEQSWPSLKEEDEGDLTDSADLEDSSQMTGSKFHSGTSHGATTVSVHSAPEGEEAEGTNNSSL